MPKVIQNKFSYLHNSSEKRGNKVVFLPTAKHKSFLQIDSITLGMRSLPFPRYPKQKVSDIFAISQGKREG